MDTNTVHTVVSCVYMSLCLCVLPHLRKLVANSISGWREHVNEGRQLLVKGG